MNPKETQTRISQKLNEVSQGEIEIDHSFLTPFQIAYECISDAANIQETLLTHSLAQTAPFIISTHAIFQLTRDSKTPQDISANTHLPSLTQSGDSLSFFTMQDFFFSPFRVKEVTLQKNAVSFSQLVSTPQAKSIIKIALHLENLDDSEFFEAETIQFNFFIQSKLHQAGYLIDHLCSHVIRGNLTGVQKIAHSGIRPEDLEIFYPPHIDKNITYLASMQHAPMLAQFLSIDYKFSLDCLLASDFNLILFLDEPIDEDAYDFNQNTFHLNCAPVIQFTKKYTASKHMQNISPEALSTHSILYAPRKENALSINPKIEKFLSSLKIKILNEHNQDTILILEELNNFLNSEESLSIETTARITYTSNINIDDTLVFDNTKIIELSNGLKLHSLIKNKLPDLSFSPTSNDGERIKKFLLQMSHTLNILMPQQFSQLGLFANIETHILSADPTCQRHQPILSIDITLCESIHKNRDLYLFCYSVFKIILFNKPINYDICVTFLNMRGETIMTTTTATIDYIQGSHCERSAATQKKIK